MGFRAVDAANRRGSARRIGYNRRRVPSSIPRVVMQTVDAVYDAGIFRPTEPVSLPDQSRVRITVEAVSAPDAEGERLRSLEAIYEVLDERYSSGETDVAQRHNE